MRIALLGGTGDIGEGLALRWAHDTPHEIVIGSRNVDKARDRAEAYSDQLEERAADADISGAQNEAAVDGADVAVLSVPPYYVTDTIEAVADGLADDTVLVSPAVGMDSDDAGMHSSPPGVGSVTQLAARTAENPVVGAFHNLPAIRLADLDADLGIDTLVLGDDADAKARVIDLAGQIDGLRGLDAGPLANAPEVEAVTPLLINVARYNDDLQHLGVQFR